VVAWLRSAGFDATHIGTRAGRGAFKATVKSGVPPFLYHPYCDMHTHYAGMDLDPQDRSYP